MSSYVPPPAKEREQVNEPLDLSSLSLLCWPTCHKHLVYCLKIVVLKISLKSPLKHNHYCWAEISVSHQPDDGKGTRFASWDFVQDRI